jgi:hypothetical protein
LFTAPDGYFTVARWAARGRYRWRIEDIEGQLVEAVGFWLYSHRNRTLPKGQRPGWSDDGLADEVLAAWYGPEVAARIIAGRRQDWGNEKRVLLGVGVLLAAVMALSWLFGR